MPRRKFNQKFKRKAPEPKKKKCFAHGVTFEQLREDVADTEKKKLEADNPEGKFEAFLCNRCHKWHVWRQE